MKKENKPEEKRYKRDALLKSKRFSHVQQDFLRAILTEETYTMAEAQKAVDAFFGGEK